jgi:hypothetical protein
VLWKEGLNGAVLGKACMRAVGGRYCAGQWERLRPSDEMCKCWMDAGEGKGFSVGFREVRVVLVKEWGQMVASSV